MKKLIELAREYPSFPEFLEAVRDRWIQPRSNYSFKEEVPGGMIASNVDDATHACISGFFGAYYKGRDVPRDIAMEKLRRLERHLKLIHDTNHLFQWNDEEGRTVDEVIELVKGAGIS